MTAYKIETPAKLNLRLKVTGKRPDGYHDLVSIMVPIDLCDHLELKTAKAGQIAISGDGYEVPWDENNLVYRAARAFISHAAPPKGISIKVRKNIPVAAGMGGGSSDAAATLLALNGLWGQPLSAKELDDLAKGLGADVPFFLRCTPSLALGIGEILEPFENWPEFWYIVVKPALQISTAWAFGNLKLELTSKEDKYIKNFSVNNRAALFQILENDLEKVTSASYPIIETIKRRLLEAGAEGALMTGSGPSVFGVFPSSNSAISAKKNIISQNLGDVFLATHWQRPRDSGMYLR